MFVNKQSGTHLVIVGPSIIHMTKEFEDYHYLAGQLKIHCESFGSLTAFGTDREINIANAFVCELPDTIHLRCKIHLCDNIERKLSPCRLTRMPDKILNTIFGKRIGDTRTKALSDASTSEEFDKMLGDLESHWLEEPRRTPILHVVQEASCHGNERQFYCLCLPKCRSWFSPRVLHSKYL